MLTIQVGSIDTSLRELDTGGDWHGLAGSSLDYQDVSALSSLSGENVPWSDPHLGFIQGPEVAMLSPQLKRFLNSAEKPWSPQGPAASTFPACFPSGRPCSTEVSAALCPLPSDSGYESVSKASVGMSSVVGDYESCVDPFVYKSPDLGFQPEVIDCFKENNPDGQGTPSVLSPSARDSSDSGGNIVCPLCDQPVKSDSELKRHEAKHTKPHRCQEPGCTRSGGFTTRNDLDRHRRSVHGLAETKYRCPYGKCAGKSKTWPRADNFRQHLIKIHKIDPKPNDGLKQFMYLETFGRPSKGGGVSSTTQDPTLQRHAPTSIPPAISTERGREGSTTLFILRENQESVISPPSMPNGNFEGSLEGDSYDLLSPEKLHVERNGVPAAPVASCDSSNTQRLAHSWKDQLKGTDSDIMNEASKIDITRTPAAQEFVSLVAGLAGHLDLSGDATTDFRKCQITAKATHIFEELMAKYKRLQEANAEADDGKPEQCPDPNCQKRFRRKCDLRKHVNRHNKRWTCTFLGCGKRFGSKNDWERHENSQHFHRQIWECSESRADGLDIVPCNKTFHRLETFKRHLQKDHSLDGDDQSMNQKMELCRSYCGCRNGVRCRLWTSAQSSQGASSHCVQIPSSTDECQETCDLERKTLGDSVFAVYDKPLYTQQHDYSATQEATGQGGNEVNTISGADLYKSGDSLASETICKSWSLSNKTHSSSNKRLSDHTAKLEGRPRKRSRRCFWNCCECKEGWGNKVSDEVCLNCPSLHRRCPKCTVEVHEEDP
ncbi:hypothetical protein VTK73DRAFT_4103 [Phialemonium thermophilum]|uniref:C2H2-type domain-containing protein n=1 Tax=Phialemonium thermophilum TaxID=223376 RepID=A0ABR3WVT2_9PEZI